MRTDAQRSRRQLLDAAIELILEIGGEPTRDAIAQRASVGIGTLYRHFPDRQELLRSVVIDVLDRTIEQGEIALAESLSGSEALRRYMHATVDTNLGVVSIIQPLLDNNSFVDQRNAAHDLLDRLLTTARGEGAISSDTSAKDIALATIRFCRPLMVGIGREIERQIAHQQLNTYLKGLLQSH
jgi:AcrR family transcriptional regulator